ncbi:MAG TPA: hypothetical protein DEH11_15055 [Actinobacteria bacterium]|nr:hypothetical protein [Actinomycetota bacterium]
MLAVLFVSLLALFGLVIDGGAQLTDAENAAAVAQEAARAGAGMINQGAAYSSGAFIVDQAQAQAAAQQYLANAGDSGSVTFPSGQHLIQVTVTITEPTRVLSLIGIDSLSATETATAELVTGVTGPGQ